MTSLEATTIFTHSWSLYDLITEHNYMFHREIYEEINNLLISHNKSGQYNLLDLGCGNARYLAPCLKQSPPARYSGVDLSEAALAQARKYLSSVPASISLTHEDMLAAVESTKEKWDVVFTGFALHHLAIEDKSRFFYAVNRCLSENGWLILVDVIREENQSRENYIKNYLEFMRQKWTEVPPDRLEEACKHVHDHDYPEPLSSLREMTKKAGLNTCRVINHYDRHYILLFYRSAHS